MVRCLVNTDHNYGKPPPLYRNNNPQGNNSNTILMKPSCKICCRIHHRHRPCCRGVPKRNRAEMRILLQVRVQVVVRVIANHHHHHHHQDHPRVSKRRRRNKNTNHHPRCRILLLLLLLQNRNIAAAIAAKVGVVWNPFNRSC